MSVLETNLRQFIHELVEIVNNLFERYKGRCLTFQLIEQIQGDLNALTYSLYQNGFLYEEMRLPLAYPYGEWLKGDRKLDLMGAPPPEDKLTIDLFKIKRYLNLNKISEYMQDSDRTSLEELFRQTWAEL